MVQFSLAYYNFLYLNFTLIDECSVIMFHFFQEPSLFAVAKLLETGLNNLHRARVLWKPLTAHLLEVGSSLAHRHSTFGEKSRVIFMIQSRACFCRCASILTLKCVSGGLRL